MTKAENARLVIVEEKLKDIQDDIKDNIIGRNGTTETSINGRIIRLEASMDDMRTEVREFQTAYARRLVDVEQRVTTHEDRDEWEERHTERSTKKTTNLRDWLIFPLIILQTAAFFLALFFHG